MGVSSRRSFGSRILAVALIAATPCLLLPRVAVAQEGAQGMDGPIRGFGGLQFLVGNPVGQFAENVDIGFGIEAWGRWALDPRGRISLRGDLGWLNYGNETIQICVTTPCRVTGDLTTSNNIVYMGFGPELGLDGGPVRLYGNGGIGFAYFGTMSSVSGSSDTEPFASSTNQQDLTFAWHGGGGIQLRIARRRAPIHLDLGARYHGNGEAEYLRRGDIQDNPDGSVTITPRRSDTNLWTFRIGISLGFPPGGFGGPGGESW
jgi:opacity protein-like surface antigen